MTIARVTFYTLLYLLGGAAVSATFLLAAFIVDNWRVALFSLAGVPLMAPVLVHFPDHFRAKHASILDS